MKKFIQSAKIFVAAAMMVGAGAAYGDTYDPSTLQSGNGASLVSLLSGYTINNGAVTIKDLGNDLPPELVIPRELDGCPVICIGDGVGSVFRSVEDNPVGTAITLPDTVKTISARAFQNCPGLTSIVIPDGVKTIGDYAFTNCTGLTSIEIPDSVEYIGKGAFMGCTGLTSVKLPADLKTIYANTFSNCRSLKSITIPDSVTQIDSGAFSMCHGLTSVVIPNSVTNVGENVLMNCSGLSKIYVSNRPAYNLARLYEGNDAVTKYPTSVPLLTPSGVPYSLIEDTTSRNSAFKAAVLSYDGNYDSLVNEAAENGVNTIGDCLIAGISPTSPDAKFEVAIEIVDGEPKITYSPDLGQERKYITMGCAELGGEWRVVETDADKEGMRFFKVKVALP